MTTPALVTITPANAWQKVATNINTGRFKIKNPAPKSYHYTYVDTGDPAPVTIAIGNIFDRSVEFNNSVAADFYIYCKGAIGVIETQL